MRRISHWIDGKITLGEGTQSPVWDPATGEQQAVVDLATVAEMDQAVAVAERAAAVWRSTSLSKRSEVLFRFRELVDANRKELASAITSEHGKTVPDALGEVARGLENVEFACGVPHLLKGGYSEQVSGGVDVFSIQQPLGVVAGITPFNFPVMVPLWMLSNTLACGNAFILKPSERDPSPSLLLAELLASAGLPAGVFQVVQGDKVAVDRILEHPSIAAVSFVGSTPIARYVYETGTSKGKRVQALGGAKNHMVVLPDADIDMAADAAVSAGYGSAGERCMAISVVVAVGDVADPLVEAIASRLPSLRVGAGSDPSTDMGPVITAAHRDKVTSYIGAGQDAGATIAVDGRQHDLPSEGFFVGPTLLDHVKPEMTVYTDEIFGPVLSVVRVRSYEEALTLVNENQYGNGTAIFTRDGGAARQYQFDCQVGMVGVNVPIPVPVAWYSFGGWKDSLFGDTHMYGPDGIRFYTRTKVVTSRWPDPSTSVIDLGFPTTNDEFVAERRTDRWASLATRALAAAEPGSFWLDHPGAPPPAGALAGRVEADLAVVGGGFSGLWTALLAKERDPSREVVLLEAESIGWAASGRNGGFCSASLTHGRANGESRFPEEIDLLDQLGRENLTEMQATVERYGIDCDWQRTGELDVAVAPWQVEGLRASYQADDPDQEWFDTEALRAEVHSPTYLAGLWDRESCALVDPARLAWGLRRACLERGVRLFERTAVSSLSEWRGGIKLTCDLGAVHAKSVALATNAFRPLLRRVRPYVIPVYDYVLMTEPLTVAQLDSVGWSRRQGIGDSGNQFHYYRLSADNRILWGGYDAVYYPGKRVRAEYDQRPATFLLLAQQFFETFPQLEGLRFSHRWGGAIDTCSRFCAYFGAAHRGRVAYALGYTGLGVGATRFGANVMLDLLSGEETARTKLAMVRSRPIPFPPEPLATATIQATRWSLGRADRHDGRRNTWLRTLDRIGAGFDS